MTSASGGARLHAAPRGIVPFLRVLLLTLSLGLLCAVQTTLAANFTRGTAAATRFGVHEITLTGNGSVANPYDTLATVTFTPPSGAANAVTVQAFHDGGNTWRARLYVSETGAWTWASSSSSDSGLNAKSGAFSAVASPLRGKLKKHPADAKAWATDDGAWFLNTSDTAYYLFNDALTSWQQFVADDWALGVTSLRVNLVGALRQAQKQQSSDGWDRIFSDGTRTRPNVAAFQTQDARMEWMLNNHPDLYLQLIVTPEPSNGWGQDESFWAGLSSTQRTRFLRYVVARYAAWPQVFWLVTNDAFHGAGFPNNDAMVSEIGAYLAANDPWKSKNLRSSGRNRDQPFYFTSAPWVSYIHLETSNALPADQVGSYASAPMHVFNGEDWYESEQAITNDAYFFRRLFWSWTLSGGSANYGGYWNTIVPYDATSFTGLDDLPHLFNFFEANALSLAGFIPHDAKATGPTGAKRVKLMRKADDSALVLYHPNAASEGTGASLASGTATLTLTNLAARTYALRWLRADDGVVVDAANFAHAGGNKSLTAPWAGKDVVACLRAATSTPPAGDVVLAHYTFDAASGAITNQGTGGSALDLTNTGGSAGRDNTGAGGYGATARTGYGQAFNVLASGDGAYHSGSSGSSTGGGLVTAAAVAQSSLQGSDGAFTYEAFVSLGSGVGEQTILSHDGPATRGFHFHLSGGQLRFYDGAIAHAANLPVSGAHAFAASQWFHVAVTYNGQAGVAGNLRFYWTSLGSTVSQGNFIGSATLAADLPGGVDNLLGVGTTTRSAFRFELRGLVDEVRVANHAVAPGAFAFLSSGTPPAPTSYEAEDAPTKSGVSVQTTNAGYTGSGYADFGGNGTYVEWTTITVPSAGAYTLSFRYAANSARQCELRVNGASAGNLAFAATGSAWTNWQAETKSVTLNAGANTLRITANTAAGGPNLDRVDRL